MFIRVYNVCKTFPALEPLTLRKTKARDVYKLFRKVDLLNREIDKARKKAEKQSKKEEMIDCTGQDTGWY